MHKLPGAAALPVRFHYEIRYENKMQQVRHLRIHFLAEDNEVEAVAGPQFIRDRYELLFRSKGWKVLSIVRIQEIETELPAESATGSWSGLADDLASRRRRSSDLGPDLGTLLSKKADGEDEGHHS